jgi:hypothetical protein
MTREEWLNKLITALRPWFDSLGQPLPEKLRVSCSWPSKNALSRKKRVVGQCWYPASSADGTTEVLVSYVQAEPLEVAETIAHELVHAAVGPGHGHGGLFIALARQLGFTKPWKSTPATEELKAELTEVIKTLGEYPHAVLDSKSTEAGGGEKPQKARMLKVKCGECGYTVRTTKKWLEDRGAPICPCNEEPMQEAA